MSSFACETEKDDGIRILGIAKHYGIHRVPCIGYSDPNLTDTPFRFFNYYISGHTRCLRLILVSQNFVEKYLNHR